MKRIIAFSFAILAPVTAAFGVARSGMVPMSVPVLAAFSVVPWRDEIVAESNGRTVVLSPGELWQAHLYDRAYGDTAIAYGLDIARLRTLIDAKLGRASGAELHVQARRVSDTRTSAAPLSAEEGVRAAAQYLANAQYADGHFRYLVLASTNEEQGEYNMARHTGAMFFLAQTLPLGISSDVTSRAYSYMRSTLRSCGVHRCVVMPGENYATLGASAIGVIALAEMVSHQSGGAEAREDLQHLTDFLRSAQREDGSFKHIYEFQSNAWMDLNMPYYSGEATLALARAAEALQRPSLKSEAAKSLAHLTHRGWSFFGNKYWAGEEHWTCQALDALWDTAEAEHALEFCLSWNRAQRAQQYGPNETPYDSEGAYGLGPWLVPRTTPAASRSEAAGATLAAWNKRIAAKLSAADAGEQRALREQLKASVNYLLRMQLPGRFAPYLVSVEAMRGGWAGSESDDRVQIDFVQHAGSALLRWMEIEAQ